MAYKMRKYHTLLLLSCFFSALSATILDSLSLADRHVHNFPMDQESYDSENVQRSKRSLDTRQQKQQHSNLKRSKRDASCSAQEQTFLNNIKDKKESFLHEYSFAEYNESKYSMALAWAGENTGVILVATTEEYFMFAKQSILYRSMDNGKTFKNINAAIDSAIIRKGNGLQKHPHNPQNVFLVCHTTAGNGNSQLIITTDGGATWPHKITLPFILEANLVFHPRPDKKQYILAHEKKTGKLYKTTDGGLSWDAIHDTVVNFKWGEAESLDPRTIYITNNSNQASSVFASFFTTTPALNSDLMKTTDLGGTWQKLLSHVYTFGTQGSFLFASITPAGDQKSRIMKVSTDGGKRWDETLLPTITSDRFYSILDMTEGLIFMHVDNPGDTGHGTLYTSDSSGIIFSESLEQHLYPNYRDITDFYRVQSIRGTYLASQLAGDKSIHTVITFNRGANWHNITRPVGAPCKDEKKPCYLQIHNMYSISRGVQAQPPLSVPNALGIVMAHGHVAESLQTTAPDVYVTSDGGYTWIKALDGPHHYQIADHGGLLVAIPANSTTADTVLFSTDEGRCWHSYTYTTDKVVFTGLLTEPGNKAMSVGIWGFGQVDRIWRVHVIDFSHAVPRTCVHSLSSAGGDYNTWVPHEKNNEDDNQKGCLLGTKETFWRLKPDAWCSNGLTYNATLSRAAVHCSCTKDDFECDYGYKRPSEQSDLCIKDAKFRGPELSICFRGHESSIVSQGYRKIPGDQCKNGFEPQAEKLRDLSRECKDGDKSVIIEEVNKGQTGTAQAADNAGRNGALVALLAIVILLLVAVMVVYFGRKFMLLRRQNVTYRYSLLNQSQQEYDYDNDFENALAGHTPIFQDSSDEDIESGGRGVNGISSSSQPPRRTTQPSRPTTQNAKPKVKSYHDDSDEDMLD